MSKIWPKWIVLRYFNDHGSPEICGITIGASNASTIYQELNRLKVNASNVIALSINEEEQPKEKVKVFFDWIKGQKLKEDAANEERKKANKSAR